MKRPFSLKERLQKFTQAAPGDFYDYLETMRGDLNRRFESGDERHHELNRKAIVGDKQAAAYFMNEIEKYLRRRPFAGKVPDAYPDIVTALFQEWKGFGPVYRWFLDRSYHYSSGLQIIGKQVFFHEKGVYKPFPYQFRSLDRVEQLKRALIMNDPTIRLDHTNTSAELKMDDPIWPGRFIRIAIWVPRKVWDGFTTITLRRQIVDYLTLEDQAGTGSIPAEAIEMLSNLFQTRRRTIVAGQVGSGKSTMANTIVGEQIQKSKESIGVIMIEKHPESILPHVIAGHRIIPVQAENEELMEVGIESLRHDPEIVYMTEMRYVEWEFFCFAGAKGHDGLIGTFHTTDPEDIPYQGALAVYTQVGGNLSGHLMSALQSCELVLIMEKAKEGKKKLSRVSEVRFDEENKQILSNDIMRWDHVTDTWQYNSNIGPKLLERMDRANPIATKRFLAALKQLEGVRRIKDPIRVSAKSALVL